MKPVISGWVVAVCKSPSHSLSKTVQPSVELLEGLGIAGDAHMGKTVQHRSRVAKDPHQPNLRQVHLMHEELFAALSEAGFAIAPGQMGENITTRGIDLLSLPKHTRLHIGDTAIIEVTGLRNPCSQLDDLQPGLMKAVLDRDAQGLLVRKAGIMAVVLKGGIVWPGDSISVSLPDPPFIPLDKV